MKFSEMKYERPDIEAVKTELKSLTERLKNAESYGDAKKVFLENEKFTKHVATMQTLSSIRHSVDTRDIFYDGEEKFWNTALPELQEYTQAWTDAMLTSRFRADFEREYGSVMFINAEIELKAFSPEIIPELQRENDLVQEYEKLLASARIEFNGSVYTLSQLAPFKTDADDGLRRAAWRAEGEWYVKNGAGRFTEFFNIILCVRVTAHAVISERSVAAVAELFAHRVAQMHELVVELVELCLIVLVPLALGLPCGKALFIVCAGLERGELGERVDLALKGDLRRGEQLFILLRQLVLLLHLGDDLGGEGLECEFCVDEHQIAELLGKFRAERAFEHCRRPRLIVFLQLGEEAVPELFLRIVEGVARVDRVADARKRRGGGDVLGLLLLGEEHLAGLLVALCGLELLGERSEMLLGALGIGTGVGHFRKFHVAASIKFNCVVS
mgnify:CR=1 FL=1